MRFPLFLSVLAFALPVTSGANECQPSTSVDSECTIDLDKLHPTQFAVGSVAVACKAEKISSKSEKKLKKYLEKEKHIVPVVIGPDQRYYMTDHHHLASALRHARNSDWNDSAKKMQVKVLENYTGKAIGMDEFWAVMQAAHRTYNVDNKGVATMNFALIPSQVDGLQNDPYRTLSRWVRESCGYVKADKEQCDQIRTDHEHKAPYFMEFYWGEFFRQRLPLQIEKKQVCESIPYSKLCLKNEVSQLKKIYPQAMKLAASAEAKKYFEAQSLNPWDYGFNPSGENVELEWGGFMGACEEVSGEE